MRRTFKTMLAATAGLGGTPVFLNVLIGFGLYGDASKPQSWRDQRDSDGEVFMMPVVFVGWRF